jgi:hypothetical protein
VESRALLASIASVADLTVGDEAPAAEHRRLSVSAPLPPSPRSTMRALTPRARRRWWRATRWGRRHVRSDILTPTKISTTASPTCR